MSENLSAFRSINKRAGNLFSGWRPADNVKHVHERRVWVPELDDDITHFALKAFVSEQTDSGGLFCHSQFKVQDCGAVCSAEVAEPLTDTQTGLHHDSEE